MEKLIKSLSEKIESLDLSAEQQAEFKSIFKNLKKKEIKLSFKLNSVLEREKTTKNLMSSMIAELNDNKILLETKNNDLIAAEEELRQNNEELVSINEHIKEANELITKKNNIIKESHNKIIESIRYAKRIQDALLTKSASINKLFEDFMLIYMPKETVSGDFYYFEKKDDTIIIAIADCTGHGVPGGFLTMLGITYLQNIYSKNEVNNPANILNILRKQIIKTFNTSSSNSAEGLDIALCEINTKTKVIKFAGAYNPLWIIRDNKIIEIKATRSPVGLYLIEKSFKNETIELLDDDIIYLFSDGFIDQLGGEHYRKFSRQRFRNLLLEIHKNDFDSQKEIAERELKNWIGNYSQTDDVSLFSFRVKDVI